MARSVGYGLVGLSVVLLAVLIVVPFLKRTFPQYYDGFRNPADGCGGVMCPEGSFCQGGACIPIHVGSGNVDGFRNRRRN